METDEKIVIETYEKMVCTRRKYQKLRRLACENIVKQMYEEEAKDLSPIDLNIFAVRFFIHSLSWYIAKKVYNSTLYVSPADKGLVREHSLISRKPDFVFTCFLYFLIESCYAIKVKH